MPLTLLRSSPPALTRDQLATLSESTPASFTDIPPLLHHHETQVRYTLDPPFEELAGEGVADLFITEGAVSFFSTTSSTGLLIPYPHLTLHAISREPPRSSTANATTNGASSSSSSSVSTSPTGAGPCIYCQVDSQVIESDTHELEGQTYELILFPSDPSTLDRIFETLSNCAALHPPPGASDPSSLFGGLDPDSMVYADEQGNVVGPGLDQINAHIDGDAAEDAGDAPEAAVESSAGRVRSDLIHPETRKGPY
ncbi:BQ2448_7570 [Microbotryum intermedium]|uniref:BQ2448_7570 protein n=1 Tax=Microbotryum intermedium TaxID=269621 RepID=A0A238FQS0_9BASI|nr:BQ2448_7570 [Microbotryum intermedium]